MCELPCAVDEIVITMVLCFPLKWLYCWYIEAMTYLLISSLLEGFQLTEGGLPLGSWGEGSKKARGGRWERKRDEAPAFPSSLLLLLSILIGIIPSGIPF